MQTAFRRNKRARVFLLAAGIACCAFAVSTAMTHTAIAAESADPVSNPFPRRLNAPDFPRDAPWLNVSGPLRKQDLKGA